jgi:hypothetical protein
MKIENKLGPSDFSFLAEAFRGGEADSVELLPTLDFGFVKILPLTVSGVETEYAVSTCMFFADPIGYTLFVDTGTEEHGIWKRSKKIELDLKRPFSTSEELGKDIAYGLMLVEKAVNYSCLRRGEIIDNCYVVDSKSIDRQIEKKKKEKQRESRREKLKPFEIVHAETGYELCIQPDLVPIFWKRDKYDLHGVKNTYCMLPRNFVKTLLNCDKSAPAPEELFNEAERMVLSKLLEQKRLKRERIAGKPHYFDLDHQTRMYLIKVLRTSAHA